MASYEYMVVTVGSTGTEVIVQPSALRNIPMDQGWTHATATEYARTRGPILREGVRIIVRRRVLRPRGTGEWMLHRQYIVGADGIVRRES